MMSVLTARLWHPCGGAEMFQSLSRDDERSDGTHQKPDSPLEWFQSLSRDDERSDEMFCLARVTPEKFQSLSRDDERSDAATRRASIRRCWVPIPQSG